MYSDREILKFLPSKNKANLAKAIGSRLIEVERFFEMDLQSFLKYTSFAKEDFFLYNSGSIQFSFENNLIHTFTVYGEQLSVVLLPDRLSSNDFAKNYKLSEIESVSNLFKNCLGKFCKDVKIWTLKEDFDSEEAKEAAISYLFSNDIELVYCIYLHEELDSDYLILAEDISSKRVATCFSIAHDKYISLK